MAELKNDSVVLILPTKNDETTSRATTYAVSADSCTYLSERDIGVFIYDKRGIGGNFTINQNVWGNATINDLVQDSKKALNVE